MPNWEAVHAAVHKAPGLTYLNTGSISLIPISVYELASELRRRFYASPVDYVWRSSGEPLWQSRCRLAQYVGTTPQRLIFVQNVSQAINFVASSITAPAGGEILMSDHEYLAMRWAWERAAQRLRLPIRYCRLPLGETSAEAVLDAVINAFTPNTRLLFLSHILYTTGLVLPLKEICSAARRRGIVTVIDGAHGPGMIPLKLDDLGADFYATNLHKWFLAPGGSGFLYVAPGMEERIVPWQVSWGWKYDRAQAHEREPHGGTSWQRSYEFEGTRDITPWLCVGAAADFLDGIGQDVIRARHFELSTFVREQVQGREGLELITPNRPDLRGGLTAFRLPAGVHGDLVRKYLWEQHQIEINLIPHPDGPFFRVSTHVYNLPEEVVKLANTLPAAMAQGRRE